MGRVIYIFGGEDGNLAGGGGFIGDMAALHLDAMGNFYPSEAARDLTWHVIFTWGCAHGDAHGHGHMYCMRMTWARTSARGHACVCHVHALHVCDMGMRMSMSLRTYMAWCTSLACTHTLHMDVRACIQAAALPLDGRRPSLTSLLPHPRRVVLDPYTLWWCICCRWGHAQRDI